MKGSDAPSSYCTKSEHVEGVFLVDLFLDVFFLPSSDRIKEFEMGEKNVTTSVP